MNFCIEQLMPITKILLWSLGSLGALNLVAAVFFRDEDWNTSGVRREIVLSSIACVVGLGSSLWALTANGSALFSWAEQTLTRSVALVLISAILTVLVSWASANLLLSRRMHIWLGQREQLEDVGKSAETLRVENQAIVDRVVSDSRMVLLTVITVASALIAWVALDGRCAEALTSPTATESIEG